jgi:hypothetical protein
MAGRISISCYASLDLPGQPTLQIGRRAEPLSLAIVGTVHEWRGVLPTATTVTLWDATTSPAATFEFMIVESSADLLIEIQGTTVATNLDIKVRAGFRQILTTDDIMSYAAGGSFGGSAQVIKKVLARQTSGADATVDARFIL